jgi:hypothetical protein
MPLYLSCTTILIHYILEDKDMGVIVIYKGNLDELRIWNTARTLFKFRLT